MNCNKRGHELERVRDLVLSAECRIYREAHAPDRFNWS